MKVLVGILVMILIAGAAASAFLAYKYFQQGRRINSLEKEIDTRDKLVSSINRSFSKQLLFIHHSVGSQWLDQGELRTEILKCGIGVHNATYGDQIGEYTDMSDWAGKFSNQMDKLLKFDYHPDSYYEGPSENDIIMIKSCFPNSQITGEGTSPGDPNDKTKLTWNYKATMETLKGIFSRYPGKTFIFVTAPPLVPGQTTSENARRAREFSNWVRGSFCGQYVTETKQNNFLVFDFFDLLADQSNCLKAEYRINDQDSHPNAHGLKAATKALIDFFSANGILEGNRVPEVSAIKIND